MNPKLKFLYWASLTCVFWSCMREEFNANSNFNTEIIVTSHNHLAFPDLFFYKNTWYLTYRESDAHVLGSFSRIRVLSSKDFRNWNEINFYELDEFDLRDPKFSFNKEKDSMYLHIHAASNGETYGSIRKNFIINFKKELNLFSDEPFVNELKFDPQYQNVWMWKPFWINNYLIVGGYRHGNLRFYKYSSVNSDPLIFYSLIGNRSTETSITISRDTVYFLVRRQDDALLGRITQSELLDFQQTLEPLTINWVSLPFPELGGPNLIVHNSIAYIGGRINESKTAIIEYSLQNNEIQNVTELYSYFDNSYPGMLLKDSLIYGVYYTQTPDYKKYQIRSFIYSVNVEYE